jgi:multiple antibiotic resistance protein
MKGKDEGPRANAKTVRASRLDVGLQLAITCERSMDVHFVATAFATAFTIIDPIGMIPMTLAATARVSPERRNQIIDQAVLVAAGIILFMGAVGRLLLDYLGVTLPAFVIAGGILLFLIAIDMLFARPTRAKLTEAEEREAAAGENPAVFPLAVPMIAGPGTIATVLLLVNLSRGNKFDVVVVTVAYAVALIVTWLCMRGSTWLQRWIGTTGIHVVTRLLGIILAALAVQFVLNGLAQTPLLRR